MRCSLGVVGLMIINFCAPAAYASTDQYKPAESQIMDIFSRFYDDSLESYRILGASIKNQNIYPSTIQELNDDERDLYCIGKLGDAYNDLLSHTKTIMNDYLSEDLSDAMKGIKVGSRDRSRIFIAKVHIRAAHAVALRVENVCEQNPEILEQAEKLANNTGLALGALNRLAAISNQRHQGR